LIEEKEAILFLKKRTKKLSFFLVRAERWWHQSQTNKNLLFLFLKKEILPSFLY